VHAGAGDRRREVCAEVALIDGTADVVLLKVGVAAMGAAAIQGRRGRWGRKRGAGGAAKRRPPRDRDCARAPCGPRPRCAQVDDALAAPVLDAGVSAGEPYYLHGQSTQAQGDSSSVSHGVIAATELDARSHIRGDAPSGMGDLGGGCFSVATGKLIAINVGRDDAAHKAVLLPSAAIHHMLVRLGEI
jgi:hypothetical protein